MFFNDLRQFGWVRLVSPQGREEIVKQLGPDPFKERFGPKKFIQCLRRWPQRRLYQALLGQECLVGIGNIYANESLFAARLLPWRRVKEVSDQQLANLFHQSKRILQAAINHGGTSVDNYLNALGGVGRYAAQLKVYQREGAVCPHPGCRSKIKRRKVGGRSVFWCPQCQK